MTRAAKLFILREKEWQPLVETIESAKNSVLNLYISIYSISRFNNHHHYAILSLSDEIDELVLNYGAFEANNKDLLRATLHLGEHPLLYGEESRIVHLEKI
ncbi:MAG: hypothetical protein QM763_14660 [Agriterribacter sp.]